MMDCPCGKFGDCGLNRFSSIVRSDTQAHAQTDADERLTPATLVGVSNFHSLLNILTTFRQYFTDKYLLVAPDNEKCEVGTLALNG